MRRWPEESAVAIASELCFPVRFDHLYGVLLRIAFENDWEEHFAPEALKRRVPALRGLIFRVDSCLPDRR